MGRPETVELRAESQVAAEVPSIAALIVPLLAHWKVVVGLPLVAGALTVAISAIVPRTYTATATFTAEVGTGSVLPSNIADLAGRFGLAGGRTGSSQPDFFAEVLTSREILIPTLQTSFVDDRYSPPKQWELLDILKVGGTTPNERLGKGVIRLQELVHASFSTRTDIVTLSVDAPTAQLAADIANRMVQLLDSFNIVRRQYQSRELRRFASERLSQAQQELRAAEDSSLRFLEANRSFTESPVLLFKAKRLQREVDLRQEIVLTLARAYEEARIAEHRDVPLLSIIDPARPPHKRSSPRILLYGLIAVFASGVVVVLGGYAHSVWTREAVEDPASHEALAEAWTSVLGGARRVVGRR